jgi:hypothetical protein
LDASSSLKVSYNRMAQYIHLLSNTAASTPVDIWTPTTNNIRPQIADQVAVGYFKNFDKNKYEFSLEAYYKFIDDLVDYIDGADLILNDLVEGQVLAGIGRAFGAELFVRKSKGRLNGWVSYTLARSERLIEGINNDDWYPSRFDQLHNFSASAFYELSKRTNLGVNFVYNTGTPVTLPTSRYYQQGILVPHNTDNVRNNIRIPAYHRLDLSLTLLPKDKPNRKWSGEWVFAVYNVYNRRNPFSIFFRQEAGRQLESQPVNTEAIKFSVVGNFIPAITYNFKFK